MLQDAYNRCIRGCIDGRADLDDGLLGEAGSAVPQRVDLHLGAVQPTQPLEEGRLRMRDLGPAKTR